MGLELRGTVRLLGLGLRARGIPRRAVFVSALPQCGGGGEGSTHASRSCESTRDWKAASFGSSGGTSSGGEPFWWAQERRRLDGIVE